jgi:hypothetical protein
VLWSSETVPGSFQRYSGRRAGRLLSGQQSGVETFEFGGLFTPVWVTGQMATNSSKKSLYLIDGSSDIDVGYSLRASQVGQTVQVTVLRDGMRMTVPVTLEQRR